MSDEERLLGEFVARMASVCDVHRGSYRWFAGWAENGEGGERGATSSGESACVGLWAVVGVYGSVNCRWRWGEDWRQCGLAEWAWRLKIGYSRAWKYSMLGFLHPRGVVECPPARFNREESPFFDRF